MHSLSVGREPPWGNHPILVTCSKRLTAPHSRPLLVEQPFAFGTSLLHTVNPSRGATTGEHATTHQNARVEINPGSAEGKTQTLPCGTACFLCGLLIHTSNMCSYLSRGRKPSPPTLACRVEHGCVAVIQTPDQDGQMGCCGQELTYRSVDLGEFHLWRLSCSARPAANGQVFSIRFFSEFWQWVLEAWAVYSLLKQSAQRQTYATGICPVQRPPARHIEAALYLCSETLNFSN